MVYNVFKKKLREELSNTFIGSRKMKVFFMEILKKF